MTNVAAWDASIEHLSDARTPVEIERLARAQVHLMRRVTPAEATGGDLMVIRGSRDGMSINP